MSYRDGVMAERKRAILVALQAMGENAQPCETGHAVAHKISAAGEELALPVEQWNADFSVFGERRLVLTVPTFLESQESPFTSEGRKRLRHLERLVDILRKHYSDAALDMVSERVLQAISLEDDVYHLRQDKRQLQDKVNDLEEAVRGLTAQLEGKLG